MASIFWHTGKDGTRYAYAQGRDREGKRYSRRLGSVTPVEAEHLRAEIEREVEARDQRPTAVEARDALSKFIASCTARNLSEATVDYYKEKLGVVFDTLGTRRLKDWRSVDLESLLASKAETWSPSTVGKVIGACKTFIAWAADRLIACPDFTRGVKKPRVRHEESPPYDPAQVDAIMAAAAGHWLEVPVALALYAGLSQGDLYALTWEEVDLPAGLLRRRRQKTGQGRPLPINSRLAAILKAHRATHGMVCRGLPESKSSANKALHRLLVRAGVERVGEKAGGWHRFRHTCGTALSAAGVDVATVGALLQHRPGSPVTLKYIHTHDDRMREAVAKTERASGTK